jgi:threonine aldolase
VHLLGNHFQKISDQFSKQAADQIRKTIQCPEATVRFLIGGTQTNQVVINTVLKPYEGVISADTGFRTLNRFSNLISGLF